MSLKLALSVVVTLLAAPALAHADPCAADVSRLRLGQRFEGTVRYVGDGDSLCVGPSADPSTWIEVRLQNWFAPELHDAGGAQAKALTKRLAAGRSAVCTVRRGRNGATTSYDRVIATCAIGGRDLAALLRAAGGQQGGRAFR